MYSFLIEGRRAFDRLPGAFPVPWPAVLGTICVVVVLDWSVWLVIFLEDWKAGMGSFLSHM